MIYSEPEREIAELDMHICNLRLSNLLDPVSIFSMEQKKLPLKPGQRMYSKMLLCESMSHIVSSNLSTSLHASFPYRPRG